MLAKWKEKLLLCTRQQQGEPRWFCFSWKGADINAISDNGETALVRAGGSRRP